MGVVLPSEQVIERRPISKPIIRSLYARPVKDREGLNLLYRMIGLSCIKYMSRFPSIEYNETLREIRRSVRRFKWEFQRVETNPQFMDYESLMHRRLLKEKHVVYSSYMSAISTLPILFRVSRRKDISSSIFSKATYVSSTKLLDNLNDRYHSRRRAEISLLKYYETLTSDRFRYEDINVDNGEDDLSRAENSAFLLAQLAYRELSKHVDESSETFRTYREDVRNLVVGQLDSLHQKIEDDTIVDGPGISLSVYLKNISEKSVGAIWLDIDLCYYEKNIGEFGDNERIGLDFLRRGTDLVFKSSLVYDDAQDLAVDLSDGIMNLVIILGSETGKFFIDDIRRYDVAKLTKRLIKNGLVQDTIHLADLVFLKGTEYLWRAKRYIKDMDIEGLIFSARFTRAFNLRKWVMQTKSPKSLCSFIRSLDDLQRLKATIPPHISQYEKYLN